MAHNENKVLLLENIADAGSTIVQMITDAFADVPCPPFEDPANLTPEFLAELREHVVALEGFEFYLPRILCDFIQRQSLSEDDLSSLKQITEILDVLTPDVDWENLRFREDLKNFLTDERIEYDREQREDIRQERQEMYKSFTQEQACAIFYWLQYVETKWGEAGVLYWGKDTRESARLYWGNRCRGSDREAGSTN